MVNWQRPDRKEGAPCLTSEAPPTVGFLISDPTPGRELIALEQSMRAAGTPGRLTGFGMHDAQTGLFSQTFETLDRKDEVVMAKRQMFVRAALQLQPGKAVFNARIQAAIVRYHDDDKAALVQDFFGAINRRKRIGVCSTCSIVTMSYLRPKSIFSIVP